MTAHTKSPASLRPFTRKTATSKVRMSGGAWNRLEPERVFPSYSLTVSAVIPPIFRLGERRFYGFPQGRDRSVRVGTQTRTDRVRTRPDRSPRTLSLSLNNADLPVTPRGSAQASADSPRGQPLSAPTRCPGRTARRAQKRFRSRQALPHESLQRCWFGSFPRREWDGGARRACKAIHFAT